MVVIRLSRGGAKKRPFYHVVVTDKRKKRDGGFIERLGYYNPISPAGVDGLKLNLERVNYWLGIGAQPSERVQHLIKEFNKLQQQIVVVVKNKDSGDSKDVGIVTVGNQEEAKEVERAQVEAQEKSQEE